MQLTFGKTCTTLQRNPVTLKLAEARSYPVTKKIALAAHSYPDTQKAAQLAHT